MKYFLLLSIFALSLCGAAYAEDDFVAHAKATGHYSEAITPEQYKTLRSEENDRSLLQLRQAGMTPDTARKAVWAMNYRPRSACAVYSSQIVGFADMARTAPDRAALFNPEQSIIQIERNGLCEKNIIDRMEKAVKPKAYDPSKDSLLQTKIFFQNHPKEAHDLLLRVGVPEDVITNMTIIFQKDSYQAAICTAQARDLLAYIRSGDTSSYMFDYTLQQTKSPGDCDPDGYH